MKLESLSIRESFRSDGVYVCSVTLKGEQSSTTLNLTNEDTQRLIAVCAELVVESSKRVADQLTTEALNVNLIESQ